MWWPHLLARAQAAVDDRHEVLVQQLEQDQTRAWIQHLSHTIIITYVELSAGNI